MSKLTKRQKQLKEKYTRIADLDCEYAAFLMIGNQSFSIMDGASTKERAEYYRNMMAVALDGLIENERTEEPHA